MENKNYDSILNECIDKTEKLTISDKKPNKGTGAGGAPSRSRGGICGARSNRGPW